MLTLGRGVITVARFLWDMRAPIVGVTAAWVAYRAVVIATNAVTLIQNALLVATGTRVVALNGSIMIVRGSITLATAAQAAWNIVMSANPIGLVVAAVAGLTAAIAVLSFSTNNMTAEERYLNDTREKSIELSNRVKDAEDALKRFEK